MRRHWLLGLIFLAAASPLPAQVAVSSARVEPGAEAPPEPAAVTFPVKFSGEILGNIAGDSSRALIWESLLDVGVLLDLEKLAGWPGTYLSASLLYPEGAGLTDRAVHDFNTLSNIDAYDSLRLYEAWLETEFWDGTFSLRAGQILADTEFFVAEDGALFLNSAFGAIPLVSMNLNSPIFPVAAPGLRLRAQPNDSFYAQAALFSGDVGEPATSNKHNLRFTFPGDDGVLVFAEAGYSWNAKTAFPGTCKLGGFFDSKKFADNRGEEAHRGNYAVYAILEQELWRPAAEAGKNLSAFAGIGGAPDDRNTVVFYGEGGFNLRGALPGREQDALGVAFSYTRLSGDLMGARSHHETILEATYRWTCSAHVSLQPDLQFIFNPGATRPRPTAVVTGIRLNVEL